MANIKDEILKKILDSSTVIDSKVIKLPDPRFIEYNRYLILLLSDLMQDQNFQKRLNKLRYYFGLGKDVFLGSELNSIFKEMKQESKNSYDDFKEKLESLLNKIEKDLKPVMYELYYPINLKTDGQIDIIKFRDIQIEIKSYEELKVLLEDNSLKEDLKLEKFTKSKYKYIKVTIWARNKYYAEKVSTRYVDVILGLIAFYLNCGREYITIWGNIKELTELKLNHIFVFKEGTYSGYYYSDDKRDDKKVYDLNKAAIGKLNELFNNVKPNIQEILSKAISWYYNGLTAKDINYSFLNFWTALEIITLKKKGIPHIEIVKRLKSALITLINITKLDEHKIDRIYSLRNNLVHGESSNINEFDRNLLKVYVEHMIEFFIFRLIKYDIEEIRMIFQLMQKDNITLEKSKDLTDFVISLRKK